MPGALFAPFRRRRRGTSGSIALPTPAAPATPSTPSPADTAVAYYTLLSWVSARATSADVYLDTVTPPLAIVGVKVQASTYLPTLQPATTYYWKIVAFNDGGSATGPIWSFTTPAAAAMLFALAGTVITTRARFDSLSIHEVLGAAPNTAGLTFDTAPPAAGSAIRIGLGTLDDHALEFAGEVQAVAQTYVGTPEASALWHVRLIDQTFRLNKRRPFGTWVSVSATTIARYLVAVFAPDFTTAHVQGDLPAVSINFDGQQDFMSCMKALATAISSLTTVGYTKVDYARDLHLFLIATDDVPDPIDATHPPLNHPSPITFNVDHSQIRTRVYGKGHAEAVSCDVALGETILPIADTSQFSLGGGQAIAATTANGAQTQILTYDGVQPSGGGSLVGPGAAPSVAPALATAAGAGLGTGVYQYAYTDVTAAGDSLPSPLGTVTTGVYATAAPTNAPLAAVSGSTGNPTLEAGTHLWAYTFVGPAGESLPSPTTSFNVPGPNQVILVGQANPPSSNWLLPGPAGTTARKVYRTVAGGSQLKLLTTIADNTTTSYFDGLTPDASLGANVPAPPFQVAVTLIAAGASPTTSRKLYRTAVGAAQLKLLTTLADNTTTTYTDSTADGSLGANVPISDASGLTQPSGQVNAGSTSLLTASAAFPLTGGWVVLSGGQIVRYTGVSGNTLTGIPASGPGSITTTVLYGSQVLLAPALTNINHANGIPRALAKGSTVAIWVQRDDLAAQAALGLLERDDAGNPTDGIREYTITDGRMGEALLTATCDADLAQSSRPIVGATYYTRDVKTRAGRTVSINLAGAGFANRVLAYGAIGYWRQGEAIGSTAGVDSSGQGHDGVYAGGVTLGQTGAIADSDTAALYDGATGTLSMGDVAAAAFTGAFSVVAWIKMTATPALAMIVSKAAAPAGWGVAEFSGTGDIQFFCYTAAPAAIFDFHTDAAYNDGTYHLVAGTWDGTTNANGAKIYVDRTLVKQATAGAGTPAVNTAPLRISGWNTALAGPFAGTIDDVAIFPSALTAAQVAALYDLHASGLPIGAWGQAGAFTIQDVTITCDGPALNPLRQVTASSTAFTLRDLLRLVALR